MFKKNTYNTYKATKKNNMEDYENLGGDESNEIQSMPNLEPNYEVFMKWTPPSTCWKDFYDDLIMEAEVR